ncbi:MAG TPA: FGGY-family carbohydrate kinase, partial [Sphaerochaetaceae bacterium]|nr:FGGY-family carbohydrate kinase [Sphaerochaetaceae bacterium]
EMTKLIISGGGSNGDLFMQIFADVFNVPATRNVVNGSASIGAAICTALALGIYRDKEEAIAHMVRPGNTFTPIGAHVLLYDRMNREVYVKLASTLDPLLMTSHAIFNE